MLVHRSTVFAGATLFVVCLGLGCRGTDTGFIETHRSDGGVDPLDAGASGPDAGGKQPVDLDGATMDAAALGLDASLDLPDGSLITPDRQIVLPDGEVIDVEEAIKRFKHEIDVSTCGITDADGWEDQVDFSEQSAFSLVPGQVGFALAYQHSRDCSDNIALLDISSDGFPEQPRYLMPDCHLVSGVALASGATGIQVAWVDNSRGSDEIFSAPLDWELRREERDPHVQINKADPIDEPERTPVVAEVNGRMLAAWVTRYDTGMGDTVHARVLGSDDDDIVELVAQKEGRRPRAMAFASMGQRAAALVWVETQGQLGIWLQRIDPDAKSLEPPILLSRDVGPGSSVDVATRAGEAQGGAIIYSIELDGAKLVRFRRLNDLAEPFETERNIIGSPLRAQAASLFALGGGYAVIYRAFPGGGITSPEVRLTFVSKEGNIQADPAGHLISFPIGPCAESNSRTSVAVSVEGELMVGWTDADLSSNERTLKLVRRRLNCQ